MKDNIKKALLKIYNITLKIIIVYTCIVFFINLRIFIRHIGKDTEAMSEMYKVNDFFINKYNLRIGELEEYEGSIIPFKLTKIFKPELYLKSGKIQKISYGVKKYRYPDKLKYLVSSISFYYIPYNNKEEALEIIKQAIPGPYGMKKNCFLINSGIFVYSGEANEYKNAIYDAQEYFSKEHNEEDKYFVTIDEALTNCRCFRYAPENLKEICILLKKFCYNGGIKIYYISIPKGISGYFVEADIKINTAGQYRVESAKVFKYEKDWFNNAKYSIEKAQNKGMTGWFTGDSHIKELAEKEGLKVGEINMDDRIVYYWKRSY